MVRSTVANRIAVLEEPARQGKLSERSMASLSRGEAAFIRRIDSEPAQVQRLMEMGFVPGSLVRFVTASPFGGPLVYSLRGTSIALRRNTAECILVTP